MRVDEPEKHSLKPVRVFGIGFHKTGTKSLARALERLGYRVAGPNFTLEERLGSDLLDRCLAIAPEYDAFQDNPWAVLYKEMDQRFPGSKFILTVRDPQEWLRSATAYFGTKTNGIRRFIYGRGNPCHNSARYLHRYLLHYEEVVRYFARRPDDLLVFDLIKHPEWEPLCTFLGCDVPDAPFPAANKGRYHKAARALGPIPLNRAAFRRVWYTLTLQWLT